jgi:hypothetical protein
MKRKLINFKERDMINKLKNTRLKTSLAFLGIVLGLSFHPLVAMESETVDLPDEMLVQLFQHLSLNDLGRCAQVSQQWHAVSSNDAVLNSAGLKETARAFGKSGGKFHPCYGITVDSWYTDQAVKKRNENQNNMQRQRFGLMEKIWNGYFMSMDKQVENYWESLLVQLKRETPDSWKTILEKSYYYSHPPAFKEKLKVLLKSGGQLHPDYGMTVSREYTDEVIRIIHQSEFWNDFKQVDRGYTGGHSYLLNDAQVENYWEKLLEELKRNTSDPWETIFEKSYPYSDDLKIKKLNRIKLEQNAFYFRVQSSFKF